jgi:hypothetical protein
MFNLETTGDQPAHFDHHDPKFGVSLELGGWDLEFRPQWGRGINGFLMLTGDRLIRAVAAVGLCCSHERFHLCRSCGGLLRRGDRLRLFLRKRALTHPRPPFFAMENIIIGLIALAALVYLVVAVLRPEKF